MTGPQAEQETPLQLGHLFVDVLKELEQKHKFNQSQMARVLGITRPRYCEIRSGDRQVSKRIIVKLRHIFKIDLNKIIDKLEETTP